MTVQHRPSCARNLREQAAEKRWSIEQTAERVRSCCGVSPLRAHRLARGWTLREAARRFHEMCERAGLEAPKVDEDQLGVWETRPGRWPRAVTIDLLCRLYQTDAQGLGLTGSYREPTTRNPQPAAAAASRSAATVRSIGVSSTDNPCAQTTQKAENARQRIDRTLASGSVTAAQLDLIDERLLWLSQQYIHVPPEPMLSQLLDELTDVQSLASDRQPASVQVRLSETIALLATLVADALMKLGELRQSHAWYATARTAADDSGNTDIRARVRAQAAMLPYYYGPLSAAISLAREARLLSTNLHTATSAFAAAAEARALARQGDAAGAQRAINRARDAFERGDTGSADDAFAFPERRLLLYLSGAQTFLGQSKRAREVQQQALQLYPTRTGIDPALLRLEEAICLSQEHSLTEACQLAQATYLQVPEGHRTPILGARAQHVLEVLPPVMRSARAARELGEVLALPASAK